MLRKRSEKIRVAIIGCGAVTERGHLPGIIGELQSISSNIAPATSVSEFFEITTLVDINKARAEDLARRYRIPYAFSDYTQILGEIDAAIVALPHHLHEAVCVELLKHGIHVLVEKPMALTIAECDSMINASEQNKVVLAVALLRRFLQGHKFVKLLIERGFLGRIKSFDVREGNIYNWPVASDFFFKKETAGGGVLFDTGAHTLDTLLWWLGDHKSFEYFDDDIGGVEANCEIHLKLKNGIKGIVELSRTRKLRNTAIIEGEKGMLEVQLHTSTAKIQLRSAEAKSSVDMIKCDYIKKENESYIALMKTQFEDWINAIRKVGLPQVTGQEARKSIFLIEACYKKRMPLNLPWIDDPALLMK